ncbi:DUF1800 domain-containing protein [Poriferisphaera sp. WC338]|uniref:DUF1800 domain-containing protein n=1 Tax=Poriferisphaera sp. WC338 TaxID=3425129 RepID=UPI003D817001
MMLSFCIAADQPAATQPAATQPSITTKSKTQQQSIKKKQKRISTRSLRRSTQQAEVNQGDPLQPDEIAHHVLSRLAFGPKPGQIEEIITQGHTSWIDAQLSPRTVDNDEVEAYCREKFPSMYMSMTDSLRQYMPRDDPDKTSLENTRHRNRMRSELKKQLRAYVIYRAVHSNRQFEEIIIDFWRNHFSIDQNKDDVAYHANHFEQTLRRYAFGKFDRLLLATAQHPAMLIFLDNIVSQKPLSEIEQNLLERYDDRKYVPRSVQALGRHRGLNENYARELMELHTLGVDNDYTQYDVIELARVLTGWSAGWSDGSYYGKEGAEYGFIFRPKVHDTNPKNVLGLRMKGRDGINEGIGVIRKLALHPNTATFISYKLCRYLIRDDPSPTLVKQVASVFRKSKGDLSKVYKAIVLSDDFLYRQNFQVKFRTPFEFTIASLRANNATITSTGSLTYYLSLMGQDLYRCGDPTGYYDQAEAWLDPGVMVYRWQFANDLARNNIRGVKHQTYTKPISRIYDQFIVPSLASEELVTAMKDAKTKTHAMTLLLGSPDFQMQ